MKVPAVLQLLQQSKASGHKLFALLVDPDKVSLAQAAALRQACTDAGVDVIMVGGSLITGDYLHDVVTVMKEQDQIPVVLFPGSNMHIANEADAILLLSLISGRNPDLLIGQHVTAAPLLKKSGLEVLSTGYMLIDSGVATTVSYISNTTPIPWDKPEIAACTAMAGEMLGLSLMYLDAGSGAAKPVSPRMIGAVRRAVDVPIIIGGGMRSPEQLMDALNAGADMVVVGNVIEANPELLPAMVSRLKRFNATKAVQA